MDTLRTTSAGGIVVDGGGRFLVVSQHGTSWSLPKGHVEEGEDLLEAARREIYEETGLARVEYVRPVGSYERYKLSKSGGEDRSELKTIHLFLFRAGGAEEPKPVDPENPEARWVDLGEAARLLTHPVDREFFLRHAAAL